jgi:predicted DCC family thiol-disulfide oxidoreductase YuxK
MDGNPQVITVFYDGQCGLCHRAVQFLLKRDPEGEKFRYAALQGETATTLLAALSPVPDSMVVHTPNQTLLTQGDAALHLARALGGLWAVLGVIGRILPRFIRNILYDGIAARRYRWFGERDESCPLLAPDQRDLFLP